jgi:hypothetical protein
MEKRLTILGRYKYINILYGNVCILYRNIYIYCIHYTGRYVHKWYSHRLQTMRSSLP